MACSRSSAQAASPPAGSTYGGLPIGGDRFGRYSAASLRRTLELLQAESATIMRAR